MTARPQRYRYPLVRARLMYGQITGGTDEDRRACLIVEDPDLRLRPDYRLPRTSSVNSVLALCAGPLLVLPLAGVAPTYAIMADTDEAIAALREHSARTEDQVIYDSILETRSQALAAAESMPVPVTGEDRRVQMYLDRTLEIDASLLDSIDTVLEQAMDSFTVTPSAFRCADVNLHQSPLWLPFGPLDAGQS